MKLPESFGPQSLMKWIPWILYVSMVLVTLLIGGCKTADDSSVGGTKEQSRGFLQLYTAIQTMDMQRKLLEAPSEDRSP
jgi:hypothetical protein